MLQSNPNIRLAGRMLGIESNDAGLVVPPKLISFPNGSEAAAKACRQAVEVCGTIRTYGSRTSARFHCLV